MPKTCASIFKEFLNAQVDVERLYYNAPRGDEALVIWRQEYTEAKAKLKALKEELLRRD